MKAVLHILAGAKFALPKKLAAQTDSEWQVESVDLTRQDADYRLALEKIFAADSVQVW